MIGAVFYYLAFSRMGKGQLHSHNIIENTSDCRIVMIHENTINVVDRSGVFAVALEENASTGYTWRYKVSDENAVELIDTVNSIGGKIGEPTIRIWEFRPCKTGRYRLVFILQRENEQPEDIKIYDILIR